ncbi:MAG: 4-(cytidine 5'-diphospho)-2-C-methyl-D-erythritol kinase, partial [Armatimonadota bacterium]
MNHTAWPPVRVVCRAKLNLWLRVLDRRPDGYHTIQTVVCAVSLCDELTLRPAKRGIRLLCDDPLAPKGRANLAVRAARAYLNAGQTRTDAVSGVALTLRKRIPMQ